MIRAVLLACIVSFVAPTLASAAPGHATAQHSCRAKKKVKKTVSKESKGNRDKKKDGKKPYGFEL